MSRAAWLQSPIRSELVRKNTEAALALVWRVDRCGDDWEGQFECSRMACRRCRWCYVQKQKRAAFRTFEASAPENMAMLSVVIGAVAAPEEIGTTWKSFGKALRNICDANRRHSALWKSTQVMAWLEVDAVLGADVPRLGSIKSAQFRELGPSSYRANAPVWWVTCHGLLDAGEAGVDRVHRTLGEHWRGHRQLDVRRLHRTKTKEANIANVVSYSLKQRYVTTVGDEKQPWPVEWQADYQTWMGNWSRGFQSVRLCIKPRLEVEVVRVADEIEPLPFVHSFSTFTTPY